MAGYTKLFNSILDSTIWQESNETRLLWITMLAMADRNGEVLASVPGLAKRAGISIEETQSGLSVLLSPDPYSRTPDYEGRRIAEIEGGWTLLNHAKYRELLSAEERREYNRRKQAEFRARQKQKQATDPSKHVNYGSITVNHNKQCQHITEAESRSREQNKDISGAKAPSCSPSASESFEIFWKSYPRKTGKAKAREIWKRKKPDLETVLAALQWQKTSKDWTKDGGDYIPHASTYLNQERYLDENPDTAEPEKPKLAEGFFAERQKYVNETNARFAEIARKICHPEWVEDMENEIRVIPQLQADMFARYLGPPEATEIAEKALLGMVTAEEARDAIHALPGGREGLDPESVQNYLKEVLGPWGQRNN